MRKAGGAGVLVAGIILVVFGIILRGELIDWVVDATGFVLIVIGIVLSIAGAIAMLSGGGRSRGYSDF